MPRKRLLVCFLCFSRLPFLSLFCDPRVTACVSCTLLNLIICVTSLIFRWRKFGLYFIVVNRQLYKVCHVSHFWVCGSPKCVHGSPKCVHGSAKCVHGSAKRVHGVLQPSRPFICGTFSASARKLCSTRKLCAPYTPAPHPHPWQTPCLSLYFLFLNRTRTVPYVSGILPLSFSDLLFTQHHFFTAML